MTRWGDAAGFFAPEGGHGLPLHAGSLVGFANGKFLQHVDDGFILKEPDQIVATSLFQQEKVAVVFPEITVANVAGSGLEIGAQGGV